MNDAIGTISLYVAAVVMTVAGIIGVLHFETATARGQLAAMTPGKLRRRRRIAQLARFVRTVGSILAGVGVVTLSTLGDYWALSALLVDLALVAAGRAARHARERRIDALVAAYANSSQEE